MNVRLKEKIKNEIIVATFSKLFVTVIKKTLLKLS